MREFLPAVCTWLLVCLPCAAKADPKLDRQDSVSVSAFGAKGDRITDDTQALMAAAAAMQSTGGVVQLDCSKQYLVAGRLDLSQFPGVSLRGCLASPDDPSDFRGYAGRLATFGAILRAPMATIMVGRDSGLRDVLVRQADLTLPAKDVGSFAGTAIATAPSGAGQAAALHNVLVIGAAICLDDSAGGGRLRIDGLYCDGTNGEIFGPSLDTSVITNVHNWPFANAITGPTLRSGIGLAVHGASDDTVFGTIFDFGHRIGFLFDSNSHGNFHVGHLWADNNSEACVRIDGGRGINMASLTTYTCGVGLDVETGAEVQISQAFLVGGDHECVHLDGTLSFALLHLEQCHGGGIRVATPASVLSVGFLQIRALRAPWTISVPTGFTSDHVGIAKLFTDAPPGSSLYEGPGPRDPTLSAAPILDLPPNGKALRLDGRGVVLTLRGGWGGRVLTITTANRAAAIAPGGNVVLSNGVAFGGRADAVIGLRFDAATQRWHEISRSTP